MPVQGWARRQIDNTRRNIREWPAWMRREAGMDTTYSIVVMVVEVIGKTVVVERSKQTMTGYPSLVDAQKIADAIVRSTLNPGDC